ncbi:DUF4350 domain-containing protein [Pseudoxanthomonas mexicana]|uniref:DUF4350 domain-containing protein n=1 Tax=Pseudoxanthomonas mexicana TaxID=128785 RepID=UPI00398AE4FD
MSAAGRRLRIGLIVAALAIMAAIAVFWFLRNHERVEQTLYLPARGEAGYNPLYALRQALRVDGVEAVSRQRLDLDAQALAPADTLLIFQDPGALRPHEIERLLAWVERGGHLLVRTPPPRRGRDAAPPPELLLRLGVETMPDSATCEDFQVEGQEHHVEFCDGQRFRLRDVEPELIWGNLRDGHVHARLVHGQGRVDVLADFDFLVNEKPHGRFALIADPTRPPEGGLRDVPHQALARQALAPNYGRGTIHLVYAARMPSLLQRVLGEGWPVWLPLLLALLAWLWARMQRFGPLLPSPAAERRSLLEHVRASGEHLFRYRRGALLHAAVRQAFLARLRRRDPLAAALAGGAQIEAIAARLGVPADGVRRALQTPAAHDRVAFRDRISILIQLRNRL